MMQHYVQLNMWQIHNIHQHVKKNIHPYSYCARDEFMVHGPHITPIHQLHAQ